MSTNPNPPWIDGQTAIRERMRRPAQVDATDPEAAMPPYMDAFLAHLRLLVGVPFTNLVAHPALLPMESIRFFYVDPSWTDRLVDGAMAVGKTGTREQAHHQAHHDAVRQQLDVSQTRVRDRARGLTPSSAAPTGDATITGFLLRSAAVAGWPHVEVRAFTASGSPLELLRLDLLAPSIMIGLFRGVPARVTFEEPHHALQFGCEPAANGGLTLTPRDQTGATTQGATPIELRVRTADSSVLSIESLLSHLQVTGARETGSAKLALLALRPPYRQPFGSGSGSAPGSGNGGPGGGVLGGVKKVLDDALKFETEVVVKLMDPSAPVEEWGPEEIRQ